MTIISGTEALFPSTDFGQMWSCGHGLGRQRYVLAWGHLTANVCGALFDIFDRISSGLTPWYRPVEAVTINAQ
jgi:hypothetical protein